MAKKNSITYQQAFDSLQKLVAEIEEEKIPLDQLSEKVEQAKSLVDVCTKRLRGIEEEVRKVSGEDWTEE